MYFLPNNELLEAQSYMTKKNPLKALCAGYTTVRNRDSICLQFSIYVLCFKGFLSHMDICWEQQALMGCSPNFGLFVL